MKEVECEKEVCETCNEKEECGSAYEAMNSYMRMYLFVRFLMTSLCYLWSGMLLGLGWYLFEVIAKKLGWK